MSTDSAIERAIARAGSEAKLGKAIGFSQVAVNKARHRGVVSPRMAMAIDTFTGGTISRSDLRPDLWGPATAKLSGVPS